MNDIATGTLDRRHAFGGMLAGAAGLSLPLRQIRGRVVIQRGVSGGGSMQLADGVANFSVAASRLIFPEDDREIVLGILAWNDPAAGIELFSNQVTNYGRLDLPADQGQGRRITGAATVNGGAEVPFVMEVIDAGGPGSGLDSVTLMVGDAVQGENGATPAAAYDFAYEASGPVVSGDIRAADVEIDVDNGTVGPAPAAS
jgi:hypothetical protein